MAVEVVIGPAEATAGGPRMVCRKRRPDASEAGVSIALSRLPGNAGARRRTVRKGAALVDLLAPNAMGRTTERGALTARPPKSRWLTTTLDRAMVVKQRGLAMRRLLLITAVTFLNACNVYAQAKPSANDQVAAVLDQIKKHASLKLSPTTVQSAIDDADYETQKISKVSVAASIDETGTNAIIADQLKKDGQFKNPQFKFSGQSVDGTIDYAGSLAVPVVGTLNITAQLHAQLATANEIVTSGPTQEFKMGFAVSALEVKSLKFVTSGNSSPTFVNDAANAVINGLLIPAQTLLNHIELHLPTPVAGKIALKAHKQPGLIITFKPDALNVPLQILSVTHLINDGRLIAVAQEGGSVQNVAHKPTNVPFSAFAGDFHKMLTASQVDWITQGQLAAYVDRTFLQNLLSKVLSGGPVCTVDG